MASDVAQLNVGEDATEHVRVAVRRAFTKLTAEANVAYAAGGIFRKEA
jgi:hypothetical protein